MQGLVAVEEEVPRCQIQTHVSVCGCHIRLSAADKIQQQIAEFRGGRGVGPGALSLPCTPLLLLIQHAIEFCACGLWSYFSFSKESSGSRRKPDSNGLLKAACKSRRAVRWRERVGTAVCRQEFRCNSQTERVVNSLGGG